MLSLWLQNAFPLVSAGPDSQRAPGAQDGCKTKPKATVDLAKQRERQDLHTSSKGYWKRLGGR